MHRNLSGQHHDPAVVLLDSAPIAQRFNFYNAIAGPRCTVGGTVFELWLGAL